MDKFEQLKQILGLLRVFENEPLAKHTYFKIGGPAKFFFAAKSVEDLKLALSTAYNLQIPFVVLGGGANVLISDKGFDGFFLQKNPCHAALSVASAPSGRITRISRQTPQPGVCPNSGFARTS